jgi:colicin import membrane protein
MSRRKQNIGQKLGYPVVASLVCHILVFVVLTHWHVFSSFKISEAPVYYVDLLNLPAAEPQAGSPAPPRSAVVPEPIPVPTTPPEMKLPARTPEKPKTPKEQPAKPVSSKEIAKEFEERLKRLERDTESKHQAAAIEALQKKMAAGRTGTPGAKGKETGSEYSAYIRSRLEDAFRREDTFKRDRDKLAAVRLVIGGNGRINTIWIDRSSADKMFNDSVMRAIRRAENDFRPPPGGVQIELSFVFKPQEVGKK